MAFWQAEVPANMIPSCPLLPTLAPVLTEMSLARTDIERTMSKTSEREAETGRGGPVKWVENSVEQTESPKGKKTFSPQRVKVLLHSIETVPNLLSFSPLLSTSHSILKYLQTLNYHFIRCSVYIFLVYYQTLPTDIGRWFMTRTVHPVDPRALKMTPKLAIKGSIVTILPG